MHVPNIKINHAEHQWIKVCAVVRNVPIKYTLRIKKSLKYHLNREGDQWHIPIQATYVNERKLAGVLFAFIHVRTA